MTAKTLRLLELQVRRLLKRAGQATEDYDSARLNEGLVHLSQAADALHQAAVVLAAQQEPTNPQRYCEMCDIWVPASQIDCRECGAPTVNARTRGARTGRGQ